jgi:amidophosphoribosyltransferase
MGAQALDSQLNEKCAVFGIYATHDDAARTAYYGLWALQHRGQESSGIVSSDGKTLYRHARSGLVANVYRSEDIESLKGHMAIGHNRYATSGGNDDAHNQPFLHTKQEFAFAHNGNLPDCTALITFLEDRGISTSSMNDSSMMQSAIGWYMQQGLVLQEAIVKAFPLFTGVFSALAMDNDRVIAFRDECGIRPLSIGLTDNGCYVIASETCAFDTIGAAYVRDVAPGEMVIINDDGLTSIQVVEGNPKLDIFEFVYFARPDSVLNGQRVNKVRENFGVHMAKEFKIDADIVVPVPDSSIPAALGYARESRIPFDMALIKNRYINRTFIQPTAELRRRDVKMKLNPIVESLKSRRVILVDDSIVRGTTMRQVIQLIRDAGATELHVCISCPPVRYPDFYGINTPEQHDLMAARMSNEEMREYLGADSLHFLSISGMVSATGLPANTFSMSSFDGIYPISIGARAQEVKDVSRGASTPRDQHPNTYHVGSQVKAVA